MTIFSLPKVPSLNLPYINSYHAVTAGVLGTFFSVYLLRKRLLHSSIDNYKPYSAEGVSRDKKRRVTTNEIAQALYNTRLSNALQKVLSIAEIKEVLGIMRIIIPQLASKQTGCVILVTSLLVLRTYADLWMIKHITSLESALLEGQAHVYRRLSLSFILAMPLLSGLNNLLKFALDELKLQFRNKLTTFLYRKYLGGLTCYKLTNVDKRICNADQLLTQDTERLCCVLVDIFSNIFKPLIDIVVHFVNLLKVSGAKVPLTAFCYTVASGLVINLLRRPIVGYTKDEQKLEGHLRFINSRLITNCEEIAFCQGQEREKELVFGAFNKLIGHVRKLIVFRFGIGYIETIFAKYLATLLGYHLASYSFFDPRVTSDQRYKGIHTTARMLQKMILGIIRISLAGKDMRKAVGLTERITNFIQVMDEIRSQGDNTKIGQKKPEMKCIEATGFSRGCGFNSSEEEVQGQVIEDNKRIMFNNVPLITPDGHILLNRISFEIKLNSNVLIRGPNGSGKSSLFRILGQLWPLCGGTLIKPHQSKLFYVPQKPYVTLGSLRDQIIYPHSQKDLTKKGITDHHLKTYLDYVGLGYILNRAGWDTERDWSGILSGGEKQRVAICRVFYHKPMFAILDECTSAVSADIEDEIYVNLIKVFTGT